MQSTEALKQDRELLTRQLEAIGRALAVLNGHPRGSTRRKTRRWTKAQRDAMAAAQRKRWKERRAAKKGGEPK